MRRPTSVEENLCGCRPRSRSCLSTVERVSIGVLEPSLESHDLLRIPVTNTRSLTRREHSLCGVALQATLSFKMNGHIRFWWTPSVMAQIMNQGTLSTSMTSGIPKASPSLGPRHHHALPNEFTRHRKNPQRTSSAHAGQVRRDLEDQEPATTRRVSGLVFGVRPA